MGKPGRVFKLCHLWGLMGSERGTGGTETSQYPEEKEAKAIPQVAASERGSAQTMQTKRPESLCLCGVVGHSRDDLSCPRAQGFGQPKDPGTGCHRR